MLKCRLVVLSAAVMGHSEKILIIEISFLQAGVKSCCAEVSVNESMIDGIQKKEEDILGSICM